MGLRRLVLLAIALVGFSPAAAEAELLVSAAGAVGRAARGRKGLVGLWGRAIVFNFAASSALVSQIEAGAPVDLVFTADEATMARLAKDGLLDGGGARALLSNRLAVVVPEACSFRVAKAEDLAQGKIGRLALADPTAVPAGKYAKAWLESRGVWARVEERVIPTLNVRAALAAVAAGEADAGVVYATDVADGVRPDGVTVAFVVDAAGGPRIAYPAAVVRSSKHLDSARRLLDFLGSAEARTIFARFGFGAPTP